MTSLKRLLSEDLNEGVASYRVKDERLGQWASSYLPLSKAMEIAKQRVGDFDAKHTIHAKHHMTGSQTHTHTIHPGGRVETHARMM